jgi:hypothetical protein
VASAPDGTAEVEVRADRVIPPLVRTTMDTSNAASSGVHRRGDGLMDNRTS